MDTLTITLSRLLEARDALDAYIRKSRRRLEKAQTLIDALDEVIGDSVMSTVPIAPAIPDASFGDELDPIDEAVEIPDFVTPAFGGAPSNVRRRSRTPTLEV